MYAAIFILAGISVFSRTIFSVNLLFAVFFREPSELAMMSGTGQRGYSRACLKSTGIFAFADITNKEPRKFRFTSITLCFSTWLNLTVFIKAGFRLSKVS